MFAVSKESLEIEINFSQVTFAIYSNRRMKGSHSSGDISMKG